MSDPVRRSDGLKESDDDSTLGPQKRSSRRWWASEGESSTCSSALTDGATIDAFWVNPTMDGASPGEMLAAMKVPT